MTSLALTIPTTCVPRTMGIRRILWSHRRGNFSDGGVFHCSHRIAAHNVQDLRPELSGQIHDADHATSLPEWSTTGAPRVWFRMNKSRASSTDISGVSVRTFFVMTSCARTLSTSPTAERVINMSVPRPGAHRARDRWSFPSGRHMLGATGRSITGERRCPMVTSLHSVTFQYSGFEQGPVALVGSFNRWDPHAHPLRRVAGDWRITVFLPPGAYPYGFIVRGTARNDPSGTAPHGPLSHQYSIRHVPGVSGQPAHGRSFETEFAGRGRR